MWHLKRLTAGKLWDKINKLRIILVESNDELNQSSEVNDVYTQFCVVYF